MATLYVIAGKIYDTDGTTVLSNIRVRVRNESTGDTSSAQNTNSAGEYAFNLADEIDFPNAWTVGDVVTAFVVYNQYEGSTSHTTTSGSGGTTTLNITLSTPTISALRYFTVGDFYKFFNLTATEIPTLHIVSVGSGIEKQIDEELGMRFDGSNTVTQEYHDARGLNHGHRDFFVKHIPIQSLTTVQSTQSSEDTSPTWDTLTVTTNYIADNDTGRISIIDDSYVPPRRRAGFRVTYTYGYSSVPADIKRLGILMAGKTLMNSAVAKANVSGRDNFAPSVLSALDAEINIIKARYRMAKISTI